MTAPQGRHEWQTHQLDPVQHPRFNTYTGSFRNGERHGSGVFHYSSDATFTGRWAHNLKQGTGHYVDVVQTTTTQDFIDDKVSAPAGQRGSFAEGWDGTDPSPVAVTPGLDCG